MWIFSIHQVDVGFFSFLKLVTRDMNNGLKEQRR